MNANDWKSLGTSLAVHAALLLLLGFTFVATPEAPEPPPTLVEIDFGPLRTAPAEASQPRQAPAPSPQPPTPTPPRPETAPTPPAPTPVRTPRVTPRPTPSAETPPPRARREENAPVRPPSPPQQPRPEPPAPTSGGAPEGREGQSSSTNEGAGRGTSGTTGASVAGLGSRRATCPLPGYPGANGTVRYKVTFRPDGSYAGSRPVTRGGASLDAAVRRVLPGCRADALPDAADQVNQEGDVTFIFRN